MCTRDRPRRPAAALLVAVLVAVVAGGCSAADDGVRVRDRDGAGVPFEDQT